MICVTKYYDSISTMPLTLKSVGDGSLSKSLLKETTLSSSLMLPHKGIIIKFLKPDIVLSMEAQSSSRLIWIDRLSRLRAHLD